MAWRYSSSLRRHQPPQTLHLHVRRKDSLLESKQRNLLVVFLQRLHEVPTALDVPALNVRVEAGAQGELERLAGDRLRWAIHDEIASGETLVEVALLQVQPDREQRAALL